MKRSPHPPEGKLQAFTLAELLVVLGIIAVLMALTIPSAVTVAPVRKTALYEVKGFLEFARSEAVTQDREVYVAFANHNVPGDEAPFRAYAAFVATGGEREGLITDQAIAQLSEWRMLPKGAIFIPGVEFLTIEGANLRTVQDSNFRRLFPFKGKDGIIEAELPFLLFSPSGRILVPSFFETNFLHVGIAEGYFDRAAGDEPIMTSRLQRRDSDEIYGHAECIRLNHYTGRSRAISD